MTSSKQLSSVFLQLFVLTYKGSEQDCFKWLTNIYILQLTFKKKVNVSSEG